MKDDSKVGSEVEYHPDPRADSILRQIRECESIQAVSRVMDIWGRDKTVYILSNLPLDIPVDRLESWGTLKHGGTRLERMLERFDFEEEVLPLTAQYCSRAFPDLWPTEEVFRQDMKRTIDNSALYSEPKSDKSLIYILLGPKLSDM